MKNISLSDSRLEEHYEPSGKLIRLFAVIVDVSVIEFLNEDALKQVKVSEESGGE
ncbi:hypothetical protein [Ensifer aridi]|uniref:hypothetical protein n=1 Tax=Ensifer aridi TaxID=1708715 RepID=UPI001553A0B1